MSELPSVPITLEGSSVLHQMFRFDWESWKKLSAEDQRKVAEIDENAGHGPPVPVRLARNLPATNQ